MKKSILQKENRPILLGLLAPAIIVVSALFSTLLKNSITLFISKTLYLTAFVVSCLGFIMATINFDKKKKLKSMIGIILNLFVPLLVLVLFINLIIEIVALINL
ncbi:hypothetical protein [Aquimarina mytili]|uniref:Uncharacterized protein n=1 Tax=Aquimarina mytili TaxID=874423 RepID=A0A936ZRZ5_9FLAO|nr:hypothetical protein [Aquimarina mytili]MBL0684332.1 hypothetical protein [Aquimarina mytili]